MLALLMYFGNGSESASCQAVRYEFGGALAIRLSRVLFRLPLNTCSGTGYIEYTIGPGLATGGVGSRGQSTPRVPATRGDQSLPDGASDPLAPEVSYAVTC